MNIAELLGKLASLNPAVRNAVNVNNNMSRMQQPQYNVGQNQPSLQMGGSTPVSLTQTPQFPQSTPASSQTQPPLTRGNLSDLTTNSTSTTATNKRSPEEVSALANSFYSSLQTQPTQPTQPGNFVYKNPQSGMSAIDQLSALQAQQAQERATGQGIYKVDESMRLSPQQIDQIRGTGDMFYKEQLGKYGTMAQAELSKSKSSGSSNVLDKLIKPGQPVTDLDIKTANILSSLNGKYKQDLVIDALSRARSDEDRLSILANSALQGLGAEERRIFNNQIAGLKELNKAISMLDEGTQTGFLNNAAQYGFNLVGKDYDPELNTIATLVTAAMQPYRVSITGAAWGDQEIDEYDNLFGSTKFSPEELKQRLTQMRDIMKSRAYGNLDVATDVLGTLEGESTFNKETNKNSISKEDAKAALDAGIITQDEFDNLDFNSVGNTSASISKAIASQESSNNYQAVNSDSGALGKYQIMPATLKGLGYNVSEKEFLSNPKLQEEAHAKLIAELDKRYNGNTDKILADYYGGPKMARIVGTPQADIPQGKYPSVNEYVAQVKQKLNLA